MSAEIINLSERRPQWSAQAQVRQIKHSVRNRTLEDVLTEVVQGQGLCRVVGAVAAAAGRIASYSSERWPDADRTEQWIEAERDLWAFNPGKGWPS